VRYYDLRNNQTQLGVSVGPARRVNNTSAPTVTLLFDDQAVSHAVHPVAVSREIDLKSDEPKNDISDYSFLDADCFKGQGRGVSSRVRVSVTVRVVVRVRVRVSVRVWLRVLGLGFGLGFSIRLHAVP